jgi:hypothetical protein
MMVAAVGMPRSLAHVQSAAAAVATSVPQDFAAAFGKLMELGVHFPAAA